MADFEFMGGLCDFSFPLLQKTYATKFGKTFRFFCIFAEQIKLK